MAETAADTLKALNDKLKAKKAAPVTTKSGAGLMGRLNNMLQAHQPPDGRSGRDGGAGIIPIQKAFGLVSGNLNAAQDADARNALDLSERIKAVYAPFYGFSGHPSALLVPASDPANRYGGFLPTTTPEGHAIHGAVEIKKEIGQRIVTVKGIDPDELRVKAAGGDALAIKTLSSLSDVAGGSLVAPPMLGDLIDLQRNQEVFSQLGATNVTLPPNGRMDFPKLTGGATFNWTGETASITASQQTTGTLKLEVKTATGRVPLTNQLMKFADVSVDAMIRLDLARQGALFVDLAMLQGTGGTQIKGIITYPSQTTWSQGSDKILAYTVTGGLIQPKDVTLMLATLPDNVGATGWVFRPDLFGLLATRQSAAVVPGDGNGPFLFSQMLAAASGERGKKTLADVPVVTSRQVSNTRGSGAQTYALAGHFPDWLVGRLGVLEFMVDPYTSMQTLITNIQVVQYIDAGPRHPASFCFADSITVA